MGTRNRADAPWISNYPPLEDWLKKIGAFCNWQIMRGPEDDPQAAVECWTANGRVFIVQVYANRHGWEIYTDAGTNAIDDTFHDAAKRLGL